MIWATSDIKILLPKNCFSKMQFRLISIRMPLAEQSFFGIYTYAAEIVTEVVTKIVKEFS